MADLQDGIYPASLSVLNNDLSLNADQTVLHAEKLISQGCAGAILAGTTGMSAYLSIREKMNLIERTSKSSKNQSMIIGIFDHASMELESGRYSIMTWEMFMTHSTHLMKQGRQEKSMC